MVTLPYQNKYGQKYQPPSSAIRMHHTGSSTICNVVGNKNTGAATSIAPTFPASDCQVQNEIAGQDPTTSKLLGKTLLTLCALKHFNISPPHPQEWLGIKEKFVLV